MILCIYSSDMLLSIMRGMFSLKIEDTLQGPLSSDLGTLYPIPDSVGKGDAIRDLLGHRDEQPEDKVPPRFTRSDTWHHLVRCTYPVEMWS